MEDLAAKLLATHVTLQDIIFDIIFDIIIDNNKLSDITIDIIFDIIFDCHPCDIARHYI